MLDFEEKFDAWLEMALNTEVPETIKAFSFNLYEPAFEKGVKFGIELIGSGQFDLNNPDWACDEVWEPKNRRLSIPIEYSGKDWESCLKKITELVKKELDSNKEYIKKLKSKHGVGIGFVDGDLEIIFKP